MSVTMQIYLMRNCVVCAEWRRNRLMLDRRSIGSQERSFHVVSERKP